MSASLSRVERPLLPTACRGSRVLVSETGIPNKRQGIMQYHSIQYNKMTCLNELTQAQHFTHVEQIMHPKRIHISFNITPTALRARDNAVGCSN